MADADGDALIGVVRRFCAREVDALSNDRRSALPESLLDRARELGLFALSVPERWGGLGLSIGETARIVAELARADRSLATMIGLHNGLGTRAVVELGSDAQRHEWLPSLATGERVGAFAATEPGAGSDLTAIRSTARTVGKTLRVHGEKSYVTNAAHAGLYTVLVRTPDEGPRATALVLVPRTTAGLVVGPEERKLGLRASSTCSLHFDDATIAQSLRIAAQPPRGGAEHAHRALEWGRTLLAAGCLGTARAALEHTLSHARTRRQFGRPLIALGAVRAHVASIAATTATLEALLGVTTEAEERGAPIALRSAALKVVASELAYDACDRAIQVHGALGFLEDVGVALLARDCRVTRIFEGANDVLLLRLGTALLAGESLGRDVVGEGPLELLHFETSVRLETVVATVRRALGVSAVQHQALVLHLARADVALHTSAACLGASFSAAPVRARLLRHAARCALARATLALALADGADALAAHEDDVVEGLVTDDRLEEMFA